MTLEADGNNGDPLPDRVVVVCSLRSRVDWAARPDPNRSGGAGGAAAVDVDGVAERLEPGVFGDAVERSAQRPLDLGGQGEVLHDSAGTADEMMMVPHQIFREFEVSIDTSMDEPAHHAGFLEERKVSVRRTLRGTRREVEEFAQCHRPVSAQERRDELASAGGEAQVVLGEACSDEAIERTGCSDFIGIERAFTALDIMLDNGRLRWGNHGSVVDRSHFDEPVDAGDEQLVGAGPPRHVADTDGVFAYVERDESLALLAR